MQLLDPLITHKSSVRAGLPQNVQDILSYRKDRLQRLKDSASSTNSRSASMPIVPRGISKQNKISNSVSDATAVSPLI